MPTRQRLSVDDLDAFMAGEQVGAAALGALLAKAEDETKEAQAQAAAAQERAKEAIRSAERQAHEAERRAQDLAKHFFQALEVMEARIAACEAYAREVEAQAAPGDPHATRRIEEAQAAAAAAQERAEREIAAVKAQAAHERCNAEARSNAAEARVEALEQQIRQARKALGAGDDGDRPALRPSIVFAVPDEAVRH